MSEHLLDNNLSLFTVREAASLLRVSKSLVYGLVESGRLSASRLGKGRGAIRITKADLISYIEDNRTEASGATTRQPRRREKLKHIRL